MNSRERLLLEINQETPREPLKVPVEPFWTEERKMGFIQNLRILSVFGYGILVGLCPIYVIN
jgi:hypothetical protein